MKRERVTRRVVGKGKARTGVTTRETVVEYKFWDRPGALSRLFDHPGLSTAPPLGVLLATLPASAAAELRVLLAQGR